jgi:prophage antirepressor-like protein
MNQLQIFRHADFGSVEIIEEDGKFLFGATQVAKVLRYANPHDAIGRHCRVDGVVKREVIDSLGRTQETNFIDEGNLYRLVVKSKLPEAEKFELWVFDELIPSIRKNGFYLPTTDVQVPELLEKVNALENKLESFVTLNSFEARLLQKAIAKRVYELVLDKAERPAAFKELHREIKDRFGVPSYSDVPRLELQDALNYVKGWVPKRRAS